MADKNVLAEAWRTIVGDLGYDLSNAHLTNTPERVGRFMADWHTLGKEPPVLTCFPNNPRVDEMIAVGNLSFFSLCAHHGVPFYGTAAVGYVPGEKVLGLSKFARVVDHFAHRFQTQEQLTAEIADYLGKGLEPKGLAVVMKATHMCMSMRGVRKLGHMTTTSVMRGALRDSPVARAELFALLGAQ